MGRTTRAIVIAVEVVLVLVIATRWSGAESGAGERDAIASRSVASSGEDSGPAPSSASPTSAPAPGAAASSTTVPATADTSAAPPEGTRNSVFGRNVYNVFDTARVTGFGNNDLKSMFVGPTSSMCSGTAQTIVNTFGFLTAPNCGVTTITGSLLTGIQ